MSEDRFLVAAVVACYNVARYLPHFLASLQNQSVGIERVQLIFVDDGSTDDTLAVLQEWASSHPAHVTVVPQDNAWVAAARNRGIDELESDWVTFADPDDVLDDRYFEEVFKFIDLHGDTGVAMLEAHQMRLTDEGVLTNNHPLRGKFDRKSRIVDLHVEPVIQLSVNSAFFRVAGIRQGQVRFDGRVRPVFEDAHFVARYLLATNSHIVGLMASAKYHYRIRSDGTSLMQTHFDQPGKYTSVLRHGHLDLLERAALQGTVPRWLEYMVLYDVFWYFKNERALQSLTAAAPVQVFPEFHDLMGKIRRHITDASIWSFDVMGVEEAVRLSFAAGYALTDLVPKVIRLDKVDETLQQVALSYWFRGELPAESFEVDALKVAPLFETVQEYTYFGRTLLKRRRVWLKRGQVTSARVGDRPLTFEHLLPPAPLEILTRKQLNPFITEQRAAAAPRFDLSETPTQHRQRVVREWVRSFRQRFTSDSRFDRRLARALRTPRTKARYRDAWVFMDRDTDANDNAEHLYRHVTANHPEVNAWFVLERHSIDWSRLEAEGFRLVAYKSFDWYLLLFHAAHLASSHIDAYVVAPLRRDRFGSLGFKYTFLQHGVTNYDISRWVNSKPVDLFVTVTPQEHAAIAGPGPYLFSDREAVLTGFPRHDALLRRRRAVTEQDHDLIVVMPTWRKKLAGRQVEGSNERAKNPDFMSSEFARNYLALLRSEHVRDIAEAAGKQLAFMPHPNIRPYLADFDLPPHVLVLDFAEDNVQDVLARASAFITDYSSLAFDAAFLDIPVVYFQFDASSFFDGTHVGRRGYFDYERDGFGPVATDLASVETALADVAARRFESASEFRDRSGRAFITRDEDNSERTFQAMKALASGRRIARPGSSIES
jgi:glycosyltransferase involved in cell wall biosynthesis/CDP-glycerol glycerophosphotransferase (TagB/SpsB family)